MNNYLAKPISALISDSNEDFYFAQAHGLTVALAKAEGHHFIGDVVSGLVYLDKSNKIRLTTLPQEVTLETYGWGRVVEVRRDLGVFVATGLPDKDVVVSLDDLPLDKSQWPKKDDQLYVKLQTDNKNRLWAHLAWAEDFQNLSGRAYDNMLNESLRAIVYRIKESGTFVYLPDNNMLGFIHPTETLGQIRIGQEMQVRVIGFNARNKTLNLSMKPRVFEMLDADGQMILAYLENVGGHMFYNDKSSPEDIRSTFGLSKGQFKKALGGLMKAGKVKQDSDGTQLINHQNSEI
ncbi:MAG: S1 RNA-binding domain-containing protein [Streptococcaceae bacterium]|jgi:predicted RNA-binding protein (virulence factor B family)|nr:S1 RNA-binding domain-containing protein [Streptococcaceae bacterium]